MEGLWPSDNKVNAVGGLVTYMVKASADNSVK